MGTIMQGIGVFAYPGSLKESKIIGSMLYLSVHQQGNELGRVSVITITITNNIDSGSTNMRLAEIAQTKLQSQYSKLILVDCWLNPFKPTSAAKAEWETLAPSI